MNIEVSKDNILKILSSLFQVMVAMGKILKRVHQECHSHGLHLAVTDVLYKKVTIEANIEEGSSSEEESGGEDNYQEDVTDSEESDDDSVSDTESEVELAQHEEDLVLINEINEVVKKIRIVVRKINNSRKNDDLQAKIMETAKMKAGTDCIIGLFSE